MAPRAVSSSSQSTGAEEEYGQAGEVIGAHHHFDVDDVSDIHGFILDSTTVTMVQLLLALLVGAVVLTLLRSFGVTPDPGGQVASDAQVLEGYTIVDMWHDARCLIHFVLGVLLCFVLQGPKGGQSTLDGEVLAPSEPQKGGIYTWLLW